MTYSEVMVVEYKSVLNRYNQKESHKITSKRYT